MGTNVRPWSKAASKTAAKPPAGTAADANLFKAAGVALAIPALPTFVATQPVLDAFHLSNSSPFAFASIADVQVCGLMQLFHFRSLHRFQLNLSTFEGVFQIGPWTKRPKPSCNGRKSGKALQGLHISTDCLLIASPSQHFDNVGHHRLLRADRPVRAVLPRRRRLVRRNGHPPSHAYSFLLQRSSSPNT